MVCPLNELRVDPEVLKRERLRAPASIPEDAQCGQRNAKSFRRSHARVNTKQDSIFPIIPSVILSAFLF